MGGEDIREQRQFLGLVHAHEARKQPGAAEINRESPAREDLGKACALSGHYQVAPQGEVHSGAHRVSGHLGEGGLWEGVQSQGRCVHFVHGIQRMPAVLHAAPQLGACAESASGAGNHQDTIALGLADLSKDLFQGFPHGPGNRVLHVGAVERERDNSIRPAFDLECVVEIFFGTRLRIRWAHRRSGVGQVVVILNEYCYHMCYHTVKRSNPAPGPQTKVKTQCAPACLLPPCRRV